MFDHKKACHSCDDVALQSDVDIRLKNGVDSVQAGMDILIVKSIRGFISMELR